MRHMLDRWMRWRIGRSGLMEFIGLSLMGLFLAVFQAFDSEHGAPIRNLIYWQAAMLGGGVIGTLIEPLLYSRLKAKPRLFALLQILAMTPPITGWIWVLANLFHGLNWRLADLPAIGRSVLAVNAAVVILAWLLRAALTQRTQSAPAEQAPPAILRAKLPPRLARARLIAVQAEDHYLRIHTEAGSTLIHMRLSDALEALKTRDGFQSHRSWWVARGAVEAARWRKGRGALTLSGGLEAPVSETHAPLVRGLDWA